MQPWKFVAHTSPQRESRTPVAFAQSIKTNCSLQHPKNGTRQLYFVKSAPERKSDTPYNEAFLITRLNIGLQSRCYFHPSHEQCCSIWNLQWSVFPWHRREQHRCIIFTSIGKRTVPNNDHQQCRKRVRSLVWCHPDAADTNREIERREISCFWTDEVSSELFMGSNVSKRGSGSTTSVPITIAAKSETPTMMELPPLQSDLQSSRTCQRLLRKLRSQIPRTGMKTR